MGLSEAVAALVEIDARINRLIDERIAEIDQCPSSGLVMLDRSIGRLCAIMAPVPLCGPDIHRTRNGVAVPTRRVEARLWAGIITNPGGPWGVGDRGRKRSVYIGDSGADSHGVHYADMDSQE